MSAIREIRDCIVLDLDTKNAKNILDVRLPLDYLNSEPDMDRVQSLWTKFLQRVREACKTRHAMSLFANQRYRRTVFGVQMENICEDFSRRTETIKVRFLVVTNSNANGNANNKKHKQHDNYQIKILHLTDIPDACRNVQFCVAEIPSPSSSSSLWYPSIPVAVVAELLPNLDETTSHSTSTSTTTTTIMENVPVLEIMTTWCPDSTTVVVPANIITNANTNTTIMTPTAHVELVPDQLMMADLAVVPEYDTCTRTITAAATSLLQQQRQPAFLDNIPVLLLA